MNKEQADFLRRLKLFFEHDWDMSELNDKDEEKYLLMEELREL